MKDYIVDFIINDCREFRNLIGILEGVFLTSFHLKNDKGRLIATSKTNEFSISFIDKYDDLSEELTDENYILELKTINSNPNIAIDKIRTILLTHNISYLKGICFSPEDPDGSFFEFF